MQSIRSASVLQVNITDEPSSRGSAGGRGTDDSAGHSRSWRVQRAYPGGVKIHRIRVYAKYTVSISAPGQYH